MHWLTRYSLSRPRIVAGAIALTTVVLASQLVSLTSETGYRAYLGAQHPTIQELESFIDGFGGGLPMAAVWSCAETDQCESVFDPESLQMASQVVEHLRRRTDIRRIESLATTRLLVANEEEIGARTLIQDGVVPPDIGDLQARAVIDPAWSGTLVSPDGRAGAIILELGSSNSDENKAVLRALETALAPFRVAGFRFHIVGQTAQFAITDQALAKDSARLTVPMVLLVAVVMFLLFRSWQSVVGALATVGLSTVWTIGLLAALGWPQNSINQTIAPLILVIALSDSIHLLSRYAQAREASAAAVRGERIQAMIRASRHAGPPCLVTTLTTAAGFASFATSNLESFLRFGVICAFGIIAAVVLTFSILPIVMVSLPAETIGANQASSMWNRILLLLVEGTRRHSKYILVVSVSLFGLLGVGAIQLRVDIDEYKLYGEDSAVVKGFRFLEENLQKPDSIEIELTLPDGAELFHLEVLESLARLKESLAAIDGLGPVHSVVDSLTWTNRLLHADDPSFDRLGESTAENAELLTMMSMKDPAALDRWLSPDFRRLRLSVEAEKRPQSERGEIIAQVDDAIANDLGLGWGSQLTGSFAVYYDLTREMQRTQVSSFGIAAAIVFVILAAYLLSLGGGISQAIGWATAGMFASLLPVVATFGVMGYAGINLDMGTAMVAAVLIGIAVDDTVHLLGEFYRRRAMGVHAVPAIEGAVLHVGQALLTTSVALAAGFFILTLSSWQSIASFGFLSGVAILGALAADLWVLPAIILLWYRKGAPDLPIEENAAERGDSPARKATLSIVVVAALGGELLIAGSALLGGGSTIDLACRTMPNGVVPIVAGITSRCNLEPFDRVISVYNENEAVFASDRAGFLETIRKSSGSATLGIERDGRRSTVLVPVVNRSPADRAQLVLLALVLTALAMSFVLRVYWHSNAKAASALVILFAAMCGEIISIVCSPAGDTLEYLTAPIAPMIAASLTHLALTFPRERALLREFPALAAIPYFMAAGLAAIELRGFSFDPALWSIAVRFMMMFAAGGAALLCVNAYRALSESNVPVETARGRMVFAAILGVPLILFPALFGTGRSVPGGQLTVMLVGCGLFVLPLGYSITRYDLFDFPDHARSSIDAGLGLIAVGVFSAAAIVSIHELLGASGPVTLVGGAMIGSLGAGWFRTRLVEFVERHLDSSATARRTLALEYEQTSSEFISEDSNANLLGRTLESGLGANGIAVYLNMNAGWRPAYSNREALAFPPRLANSGASVLGESSHLNLAHADVPDCVEIDDLRAARVSLVLGIDTADDRVGVILIGHPKGRLAYLTDEIDFAEVVARHAAFSICLARAASKKLMAARQRAISHLTTELAHDIGSRLVVLENRAKRISRRLDEPGFIQRESQKISQTANYLGRTIFGMARDAESHFECAADSMPLSDIIDSAVDAIDDRESAESILLSLAPDLPRLSDSESLTRVLVNLLVNALQASESKSPVWIYASANGPTVIVEVRDQGVGMEPDVLARACEFSFTTRADRGGMGCGLSITKDIVEARGGTFSLESTAGKGTKATVALPIPGELAR